MPKAPNKPVRKPGGKKPRPKPKPKPKPSSAYAALHAACGLVWMLAFGSAAFAGGTDVYPYVSLGIDRLEGLDRWSNNATLGVEVTSGKVYVNGRLVVHDPWRDEPSTASDDPDPVPWDQTVEISLGVFTRDYSLLGIEADPYAGLGVARPSGPSRFSVGAEAGLEFAFGRFFGDLGLRVRDLLTAEEHEVFPWDTSIGAAIGVYFGGGKEEEPAEG